jgi:YggT family protein
MIDPASAFDVATLGSSMMLAETESWVQPTAAFLDPFLNLLSFAMLARVVLSWYPETTITKMPWVLLVFPTEPLLRAVKGFVPPAFGVDITPIAWLAVFTFIHEILLGQQGLLTMKIKYGI